jgi:hypothetical protein
MTTQFDELSKKLASSMSRRAAARTFFAGLGGAAFATIAGKTAFADTSQTCDDWCKAQASAFLTMCQTASASCPEGMCASILPTAAVIAAASTTVAASTTSAASAGAVVSSSTATTASSGALTGALISGTLVSGSRASSPSPVTSAPSMNGTLINVNGSSVVIGVPAATVPQYCVIVSPIALSARV